MERKNFRKKPQHLVVDPASGDIKRIVVPSDQDFGTPTFRTNVRIFGGVSGSLQQTTDGLSYLVGAGGLSVTSQSNGQIILSASGGGGTSSNLFAQPGGLSGSLTKLTDGTSYLVAGSNVTITSASNGQVTVGSTTSPSAVVSRGTVASRPSAGTNGRVYIATDAPMMFFDTGSSWVGLGPIFNLVAPPSQSSFTAYNAGGRSTTWADQNGGIYGSFTNGNNSADLRLLAVNRTSAAHTLTVHIIPTLQDKNFAWAGIGWRESSSGNIIAFGPGRNGNLLNMLIRLHTASGTGTSPTYTTSTDYYSLGATFTPIAAAAMGVWLRIQDDGATNKIYQWSADGQNWTTLVSHGRTVGITPDQVCIWIANVASGGVPADTVSCLFDSYSLTYP